MFDQCPSARVALGGVAALLCALVVAGPALAAEPSAWWHLSSGSRPSSLPAGGSGEVVVTAENVGDASAGSGVSVVDSLPSALRATGIAGSQPAYKGKDGETVALRCDLERLSCETAQPVAPYEQVEVRIAVEAAGATSGESNGVEASGGGSRSASLSRPIAVGAATGFGVEDYELAAEGEEGVGVTGAGSHPFQVTGTIALTQGADGGLEEAPQARPAGPVKDVVARLPPGLIADPGAVPRCLSWQFAKAEDGGRQDECPYQAAVGVASVTFHKEGLGTVTLPAPVFDLEPQAGEPAQFGFYVPLAEAPVILGTSVRSEAGEDWGVDLSARQIPQNAGLISARVTFWGVPGSSAHDDARGWGCLAEGMGTTDAYEGCVHVEEHEPLAFVTMPTSCSGPLRSSLEVDSWSAPGALIGFGNTVPLAGMSGCSSLAFTPTVSTIPTTTDAASPSGLALNLNFDTSGLVKGSGTAQSDLQKTVVRLPEGMTIDPSAGVGLGACSEAQYASATLSSPQSSGCPEDSKLGTVEIETPLLFTTVYGSLYVATPYANPFKSLVAVYVVARSRAERGILVKMAGKVTPNPVTGRLTVSFEGDPPLPFSHFNFHFKEGPQAPLISPATCGTFTTDAQLTPYASPGSVRNDQASFQITAGSEGKACPTGPLPPFQPSIRAGTLNDHAGVFSPFYVELSRTDDQQEIGTYSASLPLGVTADLKGVPFCPNADIEAARHVTGTQELASPSCPAASLIGHTVVGTGVGAVLDYVPGTLYFAGPFHGDPFSVVSITSAVIGPFDLGTIVIRFGLQINPYTGQVSISPTGSEPIPTIIDGIVTHVRDIKVSIDRPDFTLNPTSCKPHPVSSRMTSPAGTVATASTPFQEAACHELAFKPKLTATTNGKTSRKRGAEVSVHLSMKGRLGGTSNIEQVKVSLPRQLPAELATLQHACTEAQFDADPSGCPAASIVGHAQASTPILPEPLKGPAIFVSHAGVHFPSLILVLQGYHVTIDLVGATHIGERTGIISTTFKNVPDEPVASFKLTLPEGTHPALAAATNLCKIARHHGRRRGHRRHHRHGRRHSHSHSHGRHHTRRHRRRHARAARDRRHSTKRSHHRRHRSKRTHATWLAMPTTFISQNGITIHRTTHIRILHCGGTAGHHKHHGHHERKHHRGSHHRHAHRTHRGRKR